MIKSIKKYNNNQIVCYEVIPKQKSNDYKIITNKYNKLIKIFGFKDNTKILYKGKEFKEKLPNYIVKIFDELYEKDHLIIYYSNWDSVTKHFDSDRELQTYINKNLSGRGWE